ncbi:CDP-alcohol phosphatidyltransferase family protein [Candidatus Bipolaricaulota bacterium]
MKRVPDLLTLSRGLIAAAILALGFAERLDIFAGSALPTVLLLTMLGWTTDIFDGRLARRYNKPPTWVGEKEFAFDMLMVFSGLCYLVLSGFIPFVPAVIYTMVSAAFIAYFRSKMITMSFATPIVALPLIVAYFEAPHALVWYVVWIAGALLLDWRRFKGVVLEFIENTKKLAKR